MVTCEEAYARYKGMVRSIAYKAARFVPRIKDDLYAEAAAAFVKAYRTYDPSKPAALSTHIYTCCRNAVFSYAYRELARGTCSHKTFQDNCRGEFRLEFFGGDTVSDALSRAPSPEEVCGDKEVLDLAREKDAVRGYLETGFRSGLSKLSGASKQGACQKFGRQLLKIQEEVN